VSAAEICPSCQKHAPPGQPFCGWCGVALDEDESGFFGVEETEERIGVTRAAAAPTQRVTSAGRRSD
jgi:predicted amidophosphoribosyltransferase